MIHISDGNSKIGRIPNVSGIPKKDCLNCDLCKDKCYAWKAFLQYPNVRKAWTDNSKLLRSNMAGYFDDLGKFLEKKNPSFFRFHVAGDIISKTHFDWIRFTAQRFPNTKFLVFTKCYSFVRHDIPENLSVVFSVWQGQRPSKRLKSFPLAFAGDCKAFGYRFTSAIECPGKCDSCGFCWNLKKVNKDVRFNIH